MTDDRTRWNAKYDDPDFELPSYPIPELERRIDTLPDGRALDVATGTGRNALFLASNDYRVDAVDVSDEALETARRLAADRDLDDRIDFTRTDIDEFPLEPDTYDVITVSFFAALSLLPDLKEALAPEGVLVYEHHLRSSDPIDIGPSTARHRFRANDLLRACLDLTVLHYEERVRIEDGRRSAVVTIVARKSSGGVQSYPTLDEPNE